MKQIADTSLKAFNTFGFDARCKTLYQIDSVEALQELPKFTSANLPFIIGAGSNLLLVDTAEREFLQFAKSGWQVISDTDSTVEIEVYAGQSWHEFVLETVEKDWWGIENLALIPGLVGAAPVQNIGAYGVEIKDVITQVSVFDLISRESFALTNEDAEFAYRDSVFKRDGKQSWLVTSVQIRLSKSKKPALDYGPLQSLKSCEDRLTPLMVAKEVCTIRSEKLPDVHEVGSAGSFFKNPVVDAGALEQIKSINPDVVFYPFGEQYKVAAGWLIDSLGYKGQRLGYIGVYPKQALVLVHYFREGMGEAKQVDALATEISHKIQDVYGITMEREVIVI